MLTHEAHPGASKDMPLFDAKVRSQFFDVADEVPGGIFLERCHSTADDYELPQSRYDMTGWAHGVDLPAPL